MTRQTLALVALLIAAACITPLSAQQTPLAVRVATLPGEPAAEAFYGIETGIFAKHGLDVKLEPMSNGGAVASAVAGGAVDIGLSDVVSIANAHVRGLPFIYLAPGLKTSYREPAAFILVKGDAPYHEAKDFNNKTFTVGAINNISTVMTKAWVDRNGGDWKSLKFLELPLPQEYPAVSNGTAAGATAYEPWITSALGNGGRIVLMDKNAIAPEFMLSGWITTSSWTEKNPQAASRFAAAIRELADWANREKAASSSILAKYTQIPLPVVEKMRRATYAQTLDAALVQPVIDAAAQYGELSRAFPAAEIFYKPR